MPDRPDRQFGPDLDVYNPQEMQRLLATGRTPIGVVAHAIDTEQAERLCSLGVRLTGTDLV